MSDWKNKDRAELARKVLLAYAWTRDCMTEEDVKIEGVCTLAADMIADLLHLVEAEGGSVKTVMSVAALHYDAESNDPDEK